MAFLRAHWSYRLPPTAYRLPPTAYRLPPTAYRLPPTAYRLPPTAYRLPPTAYRRTLTLCRNGLAREEAMSLQCSAGVRRQTEETGPRPPCLLPLALPDSEQYPATFCLLASFHCGGIRGYIRMNWVTDRVQRRAWPIGTSLLFVVVGLLFLFRWGSVVQHVPKLWLSGQDFWLSYLNSSQYIHGHFGFIYQPHLQFIEFPGILVALAPLGIFSGSFHSNLFQIVHGQSIPLQGIAVHASGFNAPFIYPKQIFLNGGHFVVQTQWIAFVDPYALALSCTALFAFDALAERMKVARSRRAVLCVIEAVLLWFVSTLWGHPEDALAVAFAVYALIFVLDRRFTGAGWLFGVALAFQPLVILMMPVLIAVVGRKRVLGFVIRSALPTAVLLLPPFIAAPSVTFRALVDQPSPPLANHQTPWTALSPQLSGGAVAAGPIRLLGLVLAVGIGVWVFRRWLDRPELVIWSCALTLGLRSYTESVMTSYYSWAPLALGVAIASRASARRFGIAAVLGVATMVVAQWRLAWLPWWLVQVGGLTAVLIIASQPKPIPPAEPRLEPGRSRSPAVVESQKTKKAPGRAGSSAVTQTRSGSQKTKKAPGRTRTSAVVQPRSRSGAAKKKQGAPLSDKRRPHNR